MSITCHTRLSSSFPIGSPSKLARNLSTLRQCVLSKAGCCGRFSSESPCWFVGHIPWSARLVASDSRASPSMPKSKEAPCIFCAICNKADDKTELLYEDENFVAFRDIRPATTHHYLVVPKRHVENAKVLVADDAELVERLVVIGKEVLARMGITNTDVPECRMGFHWPPFNGIKHLHLHVLYPISQMGFVGRTIYRPDSWWFVTISTGVRDLVALIDFRRHSNHDIPDNTYNNPYFMDPGAGSKEDGFKINVKSQEAERGVMCRNQFEEQVPSCAEMANHFENIYEWNDFDEGYTSAEILRMDVKAAKFNSLIDPEFLERCGFPSNGKRVDADDEFLLCSGVCSGVKPGQAVTVPWNAVLSPKPPTSKAYDDFKGRLETSTLIVLPEIESAEEISRRIPKRKESHNASGIATLKTEFFDYFSSPSRADSYRL